jgi:hypothetical protein
MGLFDFLRRRDERAIPEPGTAEFEAAVAGSAIPDEASVEMGQSGWTSANDAAERALAQLGIDPSRADVEHSEAQTIDLRGTDAREKVVDALRQHGIDPDKPGQRIDASSVPGLQEAVFGALGEAGIQIPGAGGFGGGVSAPQQDPLAQVEHLARERDAGRITQAEFEAQKRKLLG